MSFINHPSYYGLINELDKQDERIHKYIDMYNTQGFEPTECWNLDNTIAKFITPRLKYLKEHKCGYPGNLTENEWDDIMDKMIYAFENYKIGHIEEENEKKIDEGVFLFAKWFRNLWD